MLATVGVFYGCSKINDLRVSGSTEHGHLLGKGPIQFKYTARSRPNFFSWVGTFFYGFKKKNGRLRRTFRKTKSSTLGTEHNNPFFYTHFCPNVGPLFIAALFPPTSKNAATILHLSREICRLFGPLWIFNRTKIFSLYFCHHLYVFSSLDACASTRLFVDAVFNMSPNRKDTHLLGCKRYNAFFLVTRISSSPSVEVLVFEGASSKDNSSGKWQPLRQHTLLCFYKGGSSTWTMIKLLTDIFEWACGWASGRWGTRAPLRCSCGTSTNARTGQSPACAGCPGKLHTR